MEILLFKGEGTGAAVGGCGVSVLQGWGWQGTLPACPRAPHLQCCSLLFCCSVYRLFIHSTSCKFCWVFLPKLTDALEQQKYQRIHVLQSASSKLVSFKFLSSQVWKPAFLGSSHWHFLVKRGFPFKYLATLNRTVLVDYIPVRHLFPLPPFH